MNGCVIDASVMGPLIIPDERGEMVGVLPDILVSGDALVPKHWWLEVANLARMAVRRKRVTKEDMIEAFEALVDFSILEDAETNHHAWRRTLQLSSVHDLTAYDAAYIELAQRTGRQLVTKDRWLALAAAAEKVDVLTA